MKVFDVLLIRQSTGRSAEARYVVLSVGADNEESALLAAEKMGWVKGLRNARGTVSVRVCLAKPSGSFRHLVGRRVGEYMEKIRDSREGAWRKKSRG